jgi:NAD(P)-dependent dehydrogenase (short-subunit alcohol dehydrogenase family)
VDRRRVAAESTVERLSPAGERRASVQSFENKTAVVTGGASGMGFAMASVFAREGMNLVLADVEKGALREAVAKIEAMGVEAIGVPTDVSSESEMDHLGEVVRERFGTSSVSPPASRGAAVRRIC